MTDHKLLIDGQLVDATGGATFENINPATEEVIGVTPDATVADVDAAIAAARRAFDTTRWSTDVAFRRECLSQLQTALRKEIEDLRGIVVAESGSPVTLTRAVQLDGPVEYISHYIDLLGDYQWERPLPPVQSFTGALNDRVVRREAAGVVSAITPWNYPFYLNIAKVAAALAAGCTMVLKPAPDTPWSATELGRIAREKTDIPDGVLNVITTNQMEAAQRMTSHPDVDQITFTGSTATGRNIMAAASDTIKRVTLELGGKSAAIALDDADLTKVLPGVAAGILSHAGQGCAINSRLLVPESRLDEAVAVASGIFQQMPWGDPRDPANLSGPVISARQLENVLRYVEEGRREGRVVLGGKRSDRFEKGYYVEPTIITDVPESSSVVQEEIFGPVLVIQTYTDDDDAVRVANGTVYGLSGAVYSPDRERATAIAHRLRTGTVGVNGGQWFHPGSPFGGYKQSGLGREWGTEGLEDFLEAKTIAWA